MVQLNPGGAILDRYGDSRRGGESLKVRSTGLQIDYRDYRDTKNPFILHRKETFLAPDHPLRPKFKKLTKQEEAKGLYENTRSIGTRDGWSALLAARGVRLRGHRLEKLDSRSSPREKQTV